MDCSMAAVAAEAFSRWIWTSDASLSRNAKYASTAPLETTAPVTRPTTITTYFLNSRRRLDRNATSSSSVATAPNQSQLGAVGGVGET